MDVPFTLSGHGNSFRGHYFHPISLRQLQLCWLLPFRKSEVLLSCEVEEEELKTYPYLPEFLWDSSDKKHCLSDPISLSVPLLAPPPPLEECTQTEGGLDSHPTSTHIGGLGSHPAGIQTEGLGYHSCLKLLWEANQARAKLEYELIPETQELAKRCEHKQAKQARRHARQRAQMIDETMRLCRRHFPRHV